MISSFCISEPQILARCGQLDAWNKFTLALAEVAEGVSHIGPSERIRVSGCRNESSHFYIQDYGLPLYINFRLMDGLGKLVGHAYSARLYVNESGQAAGWLDHSSPEDYVDEFRGDIETVAKSLAGAVLKQLQAQRFI